MSIKKFILSGIVCTIIFIAVDFTWHLLIFKSFYQAAHAHIARKHFNYIIWAINDLYRGFLFALVYTIFVKRHGSLIRGLLFGICIGLLLASVSGTYYALLSIQSLQWLWFEGASLLLQTVIAGILIPIICWRTKQPNQPMS